MHGKFFNRWAVDGRHVASLGLHEELEGQVVATRHVVFLLELVQLLHLSLFDLVELSLADHVGLSEAVQYFE